MTNVILEVSGGVVQAVYSNDTNIQVIKLDWDVGESPGDELQAVRMFVDSMADMSTDSLAAANRIA